jgi:hypothetical protein
MPRHVKTAYNLRNPSNSVDREILGGVPFEATKEGKKVRLRFFPKGENAKNRDSIVFTMLLDDADKERILDLFK